MSAYVLVKLCIIGFLKPLEFLRSLLYATENVIVLPWNTTRLYILHLSDTAAKKTDLRTNTSRIDNLTCITSIIAGSYHSVLLFCCYSEWF